VLALIGYFGLLFGSLMTVFELACRLVQAVDALLP
jgi:hypothetical protein